MDFIQFWVRLFWMILAMVLNLKALERYVAFRKAWWAKPLAFLAYWGVAGTIIFVGDWGNLPYSIAAFFIGMLLAGGDGVLKTVTVCVMFSSLTFAYNAWIDSFFGAVLEELPFDFYAPSRLFFAAVLFLVTKYFAPEKDYELSPALWKLLLEVSLIPLGIVVVVVLGSPVDTNRIPNPTMYVILLFLAMAAFLGLLGMVSALARQRKLEQQSMFAEMNQAYYEAMEQQHFEIRRLRHDMANHLQALAGLSDGQRDAYIREMLEGNAMAHTLNYCGDATVNVVLTSKEALMRQKGICPDWKLDIPDTLPYQKADVCALFANALDNAAEACEAYRKNVKYPDGKCADGECADGKLTVTLDARFRKGMLVVSVKNPMEETESSKGIFQPGMLPKTTKQDKKNHGLGLRSIREIVERYHGTMEIRMGERQFELFFYLMGESVS